MPTRLLVIGRLVHVGVTARHALLQGVHYPPLLLRRPHCSLLLLLLMSLLGGEHHSWEWRPSTTMMQSLA